MCIPASFYHHHSHMEYTINHWINLKNIKCNALKWITIWFDWKFVKSDEEKPRRNAMFYITAHTITQNQFANTFNEWQLTNSDVFAPMGIGMPPTFGLAAATNATTRINTNTPIVLIPNNLHINRNIIKSPDKGDKSGDLHQIVIDNGLRYVVCKLNYNGKFPSYQAINLALLFTQRIISNFRSHSSSSVCSTKSLLSNAAVGPDWGGGTILVIAMAVIFALLLFSLIILVCIRIINWFDLLEHRQMVRCSRSLRNVACKYCMYVRSINRFVESSTL